MNPAYISDTIVQEVTIEGTAERVFEALTNPRERIRWWGGEGRFRITQMESDLRPGGKWMMGGIAFGERPFVVRGQYLQIDRPRLLAFTWLPDWQGDDTESTVRFDIDEKDGRTTVRVTHSGLATEASRSSHKGWPQILAWLRAHVEQ